MRANLTGLSDEDGVMRSGRAQTGLDGSGRAWTGLDGYGRVRTGADGVRTGSGRVWKGLNDKKRKMAPDGSGEDGIFRPLDV